MQEKKSIAQSKQSKVDREEKNASCTYNNIDNMFMSQTKAFKHNELMIEKKKNKHIVVSLHFAAGDLRLRACRRNFFARMKITSVGKK